MSTRPTAIHFLPLSFLVLLFAAACSKEAPLPSNDKKAEVESGLPDRDPALAHRLVAEGGVLLDVRTAEEYGGRHLEGAVNIPVGELKTRLADVDKLTGGDKQKPIVVYCQSGGRAQRAKEALAEAGYRKVTNLGGIGDWDRK